MVNTIPFKNKGKVKMIAHRGVSMIERENTCPAFIVAGVKTYYGIETDVHVTKDNKFIIVHDDDLKRIAGLDMKVEESTFESLRAVRLKDLDEKTSRGDLFLPTVEEYISICKKYQKQAILELKNPMTKANVWALADSIKDLDWLHRTTFISFSGKNLIYLRERYKEASAQYLTETCTKEEIQFMIDNRFDADLCGYCVTKEKVDALHKEGLLVNVWTIDALKDAQKAKEYGVDFITTDILE